DGFAARRRGPGWVVGIAGSRAGPIARVRDDRPPLPAGRGLTRDPGSAIRGGWSDRSAAGAGLAANGLPRDDGDDRADDRHEDRRDVDAADVVAAGQEAR